MAAKPELDRELSRLTALHAWCLRNRVLTLTSGDVTMLLSTDAFEPLPHQETGDQFPDEDEYVSPHEKIRIQHAADLARKQKGDA